MTQPTDAPTSRLPWSLLAVWLVCVVVFTAIAWSTWDSVVDDAYISARYAEHLADGYGLTFSAGETPIEGYTNLGWTVLLGIGRLFGLPIVLLMTGLGWLFAVLSMGLSLDITRRLARTDDLVVGLPAVALALSPHLAVSATNGLESSMMVAAVLAAVWGDLALQGSRRAWAGVLCVLAAVTRPEGVVVLGLLVLQDLWRHRRAPRQALPLVGTAVAGLALLVLWRLWTYGDLVPNTFHAKSSFPLSETFDVNAVYLKPSTVPLVGALVTWGLGTVVSRWTLSKVTISVLALALGIIPLTVNLWMPGLRLFLPAMALAIVLFTLGLVRLGTLGARLGAAAAVVVLGVYAATDGDSVRGYDGHHTVQPGNGAELAGEHLARFLPEGSWMAIRDAGVLAYYVGTGVKVAELHQRALTLPHPNGDNTDILATTPINPEAFVATVRREDSDEPKFGYSNDRSILARTTMPYVYLGRVHQHYHRYYDIYVRADLGVPPLPERIVVNHAGPPPPHRATGEGAIPAAVPLPDTGL